MARKTTKVTAETQAKNRRLIKKLKNKEHWMKWIIAVAIILLLLLLLLLGFATDWTRGLRKNATLTPSSSIDTLESTAGADGAGGTGAGGGAGGTGLRETGNASSVEESSNSSSSEKTTTTTNTTTTDSSQPPAGLQNLLDLTSVGNNIDEVIDRANQSGVGVSCQDNLLIQTCTFSQDGSSFSTKNILGTGIITSVTNGL